MHGQRAGLGGLRNEYARGPLRYGLQAVREQVAQTDGAPEELYLGSQVASLRGNLL